MLCLRTCALDGSSLGEDAAGFRWTLKKGARVKPVRWDPDPARDCGDGLHGMVIGRHDGKSMIQPTNPTVLWLVFRPIGGVVESSGKIRCEEAEVMEFGSRQEILERLMEQGITGLPYSVLTGGDHSTLTGGDDSTLTGLPYSTLTGGHSSTLSIQWHDCKRYRIAVAYVGEGGILPNVPYRVNEQGKFKRVL